jgi:eukaryotic-like serine/threonine-protein kinase
MKHCTKCQNSYPNSQSVCSKDGTILALKDRYGLAGRVVADKYQIEALVGLGGMSAVYTAQQIGVGRRVAFKILLPHLATNTHHVANLFEREAKTAGQLSHENIATIYDAGYTTDEIAYIAMEWVDGHTLEDEISQHGPLSLERAAFLLRQICAALDLAHTKLIIHRDLKPSNIMISRRQDGQDQVKVLDFGLAKLANEAKDALVSTAVGTPHYASPEQFQTGSEIDARTDIYALGVTLYQMLTGRLPFSAGSVHEVIRQHILELPPSLCEARPDVPVAVNELVLRMLAKNPHYRPQRAGEVVFLFERALALTEEVQPADFAPRTLTAGKPMPRLPSAEKPARQLPQLNGHGQNNGRSNGQANGAAAALAPSFQIKSYRPSAVLRPELDNEPDISTLTNTAKLLPMRRSSKLAQWLKQHKVIAFSALLALLIVAFFGSFFANTHLSEKDVVLLADFTNNTGEEVFDGTLKQALAIQLAQSPFLYLLPDDKVRETLRYMNKQPGERMTRELAREISLRQGIKALIVGRIDRADRRYKISLEAINSQTGESFARSRAEAQGKDHVLQALGQATLELRETLGESLSSIEKFNKPIQDATTSSLEALRAYSLGREQNTFKSNRAEALALYKRAVELDPNFALAYIGLATLYHNLGQPDLSAENAEKAFQLRDRISEQERLTTAFFYHFVVTGEVDKAIETLMLSRQSYPRTISPLNNLAVAYGKIGQFEAGLKNALEAIKADPRNISGQVNRAELLLRLNRFEEAKEVINNIWASKNDRPDLHAFIYQIAFVQNDEALMQSQVDWAIDKEMDFHALNWQAQAASFQGKLREASQLYSRAAESAKQHEMKELAAAIIISQALRQTAFGRHKEAQQRLNEALALSRNTFVRHATTAIVPYGTFALVLAGDSTQAQMLIEETAQKYPRNLLANQVWLPLTKAVMQLEQGKPELALDLLQGVTPYDPGTFFCANWLRGQAYLFLNKGREAGIEFNTILNHHGWEPTSPFYPLAQLGLARAHALLGDHAESRKHYETFFAMWQHADADLPVLIAAKKEYAAQR